MGTAAAVLLGVPSPARADEYFVAPDGNDENPGTIDAPLGTLAFATSQLTPGDTLWLRGGDYHEGEVSIAVQGTTDAPIRIARLESEQPRLVHTIAGLEWELLDRTIHLYRSVRPHPVVYAGGAVEQDDGFYQLVRYERREDLESPDHNYPAAHGDPTYVGPGYFWESSNGHILLRLEKPDPAAVFRDFTELDDPDPSHHRIRIPSLQRGIVFDDGAAHVELEGLDVCYFQQGVSLLPSARDIRLRDVSVRSGSVLLRFFGGVRRVQVDGVLLDGGLPDWIGWMDAKNLHRPANSMQIAGLSFTDTHSHFIEVSGSRISRVFDGLVGKLADARVHHNYIQSSDDGLQLGSVSMRVEYDHNFVRGQLISHTGEGLSADPGTIFIHHNIVEPRAQLWGRRDRDGGIPDPQWREGIRYHIPFGNHRGEGTPGDPWKVYHNTVRYRSDGTSVSLGLAPLGAIDGIPHEVFNNIFFFEGDTAKPMAEHYEVPSSVYDGNLYFHVDRSIDVTLFSRFRDGIGMEHDFDSWEAFRASEIIARSRAIYPPGWEHHGAYGDPAFRNPARSDYRPSPDGAGRGIGVDLTDRGWSGAGNEFVGAVDPGATSGAGDVGPGTSLAPTAEADHRDSALGGCSAPEDRSVPSRSLVYSVLVALWLARRRVRGSPS